MRIAEPVGPDVRDSYVPDLWSGHLDLQRESTALGALDSYHRDSSVGDDQTHLINRNGRVGTSTRRLGMSRCVVGHVDVIPNASLFRTGLMSDVRRQYVGKPADVV